MILQIDDRFSIQPMHSMGCFVMVDLFYINRILNKSFDPFTIEDYIRKMNKWYRMDHEKDLIDSQMYVNDHDAIARYFGIPVDKPARFEKATYHAKPWEEVVLIWTWGKQMHATSEGGHNRVGYDPMGYSQTVYHGSVLKKLVLNWRRFYDHELFNT